MQCIPTLAAAISFDIPAKIISVKFEIRTGSTQRFFFDILVSSDALRVAQIINKVF